MTYLSSTIFTGTNVSATNVTGTNATLSYLSSTIFTGTNVSATNVTGTNGSVTYLSSTIFTGTNVSANNVTGTNGSVTYLSSTTFTGTNISATNVTGTNAFFTNLTGTSLISSVQFTGTSISTSLLSTNSIFVSQTGSITYNNDPSSNTGFFFGGSILPTSNDVYTLGTTGAIWRGLYVGSGSVHIDNVNLSTQNSHLNISAPTQIQTSISTILAGTKTSNNTGTIIYSNDGGRTWNESTSARTLFPGGVYGISYNGVNKWVAVGFSAIFVPIIAYSTNNGVSWTQSNSVTSIFDSLNSVVYQNGKFIAAGYKATSGSSVASSTDGISWTSAGNIGTIFVNSFSVAYSSSLNLYVAVGTGASYAVAYSSDLSTWTGVSTSLTFAKSIVWTGSRFIAVGASASNPIIYSTNGTSWSNATKPADFADGSKVVYNGETIVVVGASNDGLNLLTSTDGITFSFPTDSNIVSLTSSPLANAYWDGINWYVASNSKTFLSPDVYNFAPSFIPVLGFQSLSIVASTVGLIDTPIQSSSMNVTRSLVTPAISSTTLSSTNLSSYYANVASLTGSTANVGSIITTSLTGPGLSINANNVVTTSITGPGLSINANSVVTTSLTGPGLSINANSLVTTSITGPSLSVNANSINANSIVANSLNATQSTSQQMIFNTQYNSKRWYSYAASGSFTSAPISISFKFGDGVGTSVPSFNANINMILQNQGAGRSKDLSVIKFECIGGCQDNVPTSNIITYSTSVVSNPSTAIVWDPTITATTYELVVDSTTMPGIDNSPMEYYVMVEVIKGNLYSVTDNANTPNSITYNY